MSTFIADFETTTLKEDCRVWAYAVCDIEDAKNVIIGTSIDEFMTWCKEREENDIVLFHNLKFDGGFIMDYLFRNGYRHTTDDKDRQSMTFNTLISDKGFYYQIEVIFLRKGRKVNRVIFQDSLKLIPLSVKKIAEAFHLEEGKGEIDYERHNYLPPGSPLTEEEKDYIRRDVQIVAHAVKYFHDQGLNKMTIGSCALNEYKQLIKKKNFNRFFPTPKYHEDVKQSYRGGFTYLNPKFEGKTIGKGIVLDVNSLYPSVMYADYLPFGTPIFFEGEYTHDPIYPLYTQMFRCQFELKKGKIPTIQIKKDARFKPNEYLTSSDGQEVTLCLNSVDMELFFKHYNVYCIEYMSGWKFKATQGLFKEYIDKWSNNKIQAKKDGNHGLYLISKLFLNSLYGKFGTDTKVKSKIPYMGEDGIIHFTTGEDETRDGIYVAMASFITSYARLKTISAAQTITDNYNSKKSKIQFVYADTDSLHCVSEDFSLPEGLNIDSTKLGAWDYEGRFLRAKYLRQKCYIEEFSSDTKSDNPKYELKITVSGMPKGCYQYVNFKNFKIGASYTGKMQPKRVRGGVVLEDVDFTIKE